MTDGSVSCVVSSSYRLADHSHFFNNPASIESLDPLAQVGTKKKRPCLSEAGSLLCWLNLLLALLRVLLLEPFDPSFGIDDLLRASKKRMAARANIDVDISDGRSGFIAVAAGAMHSGFPIQRMNTLLHTPNSWHQSLTFAHS